MNEKLLRRRDVEELTGLSRASVYRLISEGEFPRPVRVSATGRQVEGQRHRCMDSVPAVARANSAQLPPLGAA